MINQSIHCSNKHKKIVILSHECCFFKLKRKNFNQRNENAIKTTVVHSSKFDLNSIEFRLQTLIIIFEDDIIT